MHALWADLAALEGEQPPARQDLKQTIEGSSSSASSADNASAPPSTQEEEQRQDEQMAAASGQQRYGPELYEYLLRPIFV